MEKSYKLELINQKIEKFEFEFCSDANKNKNVFKGEICLLIFFFNNSYRLMGHN